jgi:multidrug efflux pump subunit AcrA (membrane-fusion protein)
VKRLLIVLVLAAAVLAAVAYLVSNPSLIESHFSHGGQDQPKVETSPPVAYDKLFDTVSGTGVVEPQDSLVISSVESGQVVKLFHDVHDVVQEGDELLQLDDRVARQKLAQAEAAVASAGAAVTTAQRTVEQTDAQRRAAQTLLDRAREQRAKDNITQKALDQAEEALNVAEKGKATSEAMVEAAKAKLREAEAARDLAKLGADLCHVRVPFVNHTVAPGSTAPPQNVGEVVQGGEPARPKRKYTIIERKVGLNQLVGPPVSAQLFTLVADLDKTEIKAQIAEGDFPKIHKGDTVYFTVSAYENHSFTGKVAETRPVATMVNGAMFYTAIIDVDPQQGPKQWPLRPGMTTASLDIVCRQIPEEPGARTWLVPDAALNFPLDKHYWSADVKEPPNPPDGWRWVWYKVGDTNTARYAYVRIGASGKVKDPDKGGLRADTYTQVEEWDPKLTPPLRTDSPQDLQVITGAEPPKKGAFSIPSIIKS